MSVPVLATRSTPAHRSLPDEGQRVVLALVKLFAIPFQEKEKETARKVKGKLLAHYQLAAS